MELLLIPCSDEECNAIEDLLANRMSVEATLIKYPKVRDSFDVALVAMTTDAHSLHLFSESLRCVKDLVLAAVHQRGLALEFASTELRADKEVVMAAVHQNGLSLE